MKYEPLPWPKAVSECCQDLNGKEAEWGGDKGRPKKDAMEEAIESRALESVRRRNLMTQNKVAGNVKGIFWSLVYVWFLFKIFQYIL